MPICIARPTQARNDKKVKWRRTAVPFTLPIEIDQPKATSIYRHRAVPKSRQFRHARHPYHPLAAFVLAKLGKDAYVGIDLTAAGLPG